MRSARSSQSALGSWSDDDLIPTVLEHSGVGAHAGLPDEVRFVACVARLVRRRLAEVELRGESDPPDIAIFVLGTAPNGLSTASWVPMLDTGGTALGGKVWITGPPVAAAHYVKLPDHGDASRFSYVVDVLGLGANPAVIFDTRLASPQLRWYPKGLAQPSNCESKPLQVTVTANRAFQVIERVYRQCLVTPVASSSVGSPWQDASCWIPKKLAEKIVQWNVRVGLVGAFTGCEVRPEQTQPAGRTDLEIEEYDPLNRNSVVRHGILEFKVLRSFRSSGSPVSMSHTQTSLSDGVLQAAAYRDGKQFSWAALCCFDMRQNDTGDSACFASVCAVARRTSVHLKRWFLYSRAQLYRASNAP